MKNKIILTVLLSLLFLTFSSNFLKAESYFLKTKKLITIGDYTKEWIEVDTLMQRGLYKSALKKVETIYYKANAENNVPNLIKAVIYKMNLKTKTEKIDANIINYLKQEIEKSVFPLTPVLQSILAEMYWLFYESHRYVILERTNIVENKDADFLEWDFKKFITEIDKCYKNSLQDAESLKNIDLENFKDILINYDNENKNPYRKLRPTLYDFLAHRAIDFYKNKEADLPKKDDFTIIDNSYLSPAEEFVNLNIQSPDSGSFIFKAIILMQDLIRLHLNDDNPTALIDADLERLSFVNSDSYISYKEKEYSNALENLEKKYLQNPAGTMISYQKALNLYNDHSLYENHKKSEFRWNNKKAYDICSEAIERFPASDGAENCRYMQNVIKQKAIGEISVNNNNVPGKPFKMFIEFKNVEKIFFRIIKTDVDEIRNTGIESHWGEYGTKKEIVKYYKEKTPLKQVSFNLPDSLDYNYHGVDVIMPELPLGVYAILSSVNEDFENKNNLVSVNFVTITNISYIYKGRGNDLEMYLLDRTTGEPLPNVKAQMYIMKEEYEDGRDSVIIEKDKVFVTDEKGYFNFDAREKHTHMFFEFFKNDDYLCTLDNSYLVSYRGLTKGNIDSPDYYKYSETEYKEYYQFHLFTDRSIYRPGQTVYFKMLVLSKKGREVKIVPDYLNLLYLLDVNDNKIDSITVLSNEFGTYSGSFVLPQSSLNGSFEFELKDVPDFSYHFKVEEYKRPKFEVRMESVTGQFKIGDTIEVKGIAKSYSGAGVSGAEVKYNVNRTVNCELYNKYYYNSIEMLQASNITGNYGEFTIRFVALPDLKIPKENEDNASYNFNVHADVTDINGETRSDSKNIHVTNKAMYLDIKLPFTIKKEGTKDFVIESQNANLERIEAKGTFYFYKLKSPGKLYMPRDSRRPDTFIYSEEEYHKYFPDDVYYDELDYRKWQKEKLVQQFDFNTAEDTLIHLNELDRWEQGFYKIEMESKDKYGNDVKNNQYLIVYGENEKDLPVPDPFWVVFDKAYGEPGNNAKFTAMTSFPKVRMLYELEKDNKKLYSEWINFEGNKKTIEVPIYEEYRGNILASLTFVCNNSLQVCNFQIVVPYTNKLLNVSFDAFRNKLNPGETEQWTIKINDKKGEKPPAEMVAVLYDKSLDVFTENEWKLELYKPIDYSNYKYRWESECSFNVNYSTARVKTIHGSYLKSIYYDRLNWFNFEPSKYFSLINRNNKDNLHTNHIDVEQSGRIIDESSLVNTYIPGVPDSLMKEISVLEGGFGAEYGKVLSGIINPTAKNNEKEIFSGVVTRKDFNETAFFFPNLYTDEDGKITLTFTVPEALTKWKMLGLAHTKDLKVGFIERELITQKDFMVVPGAPRFFREGDNINFTSKITNLSDKDLNGDISLEFFDASTNKKIDSIIKDADEFQKFELKNGLNSYVSWNLKIPPGLNAVKYKVVAKADNFSDGEEMLLPVLPNKTLVSESLPLTVRSNESKNFRFEKMINNNSSTLSNHKLTFEFTSNPAWYAIQSLPYLMEYPYECSEQTFSRFYANCLATYVANKDEKIKNIFESWKKYQPDAMLSGLEKNNELKSVMLEETPWVRDAKNEKERKQRIGILFDLKKMSGELTANYNKLNDMESRDGGFPWFPGGKSDRYITQHIVSGFAHLKELGATPINLSISKMILPALQYLDDRIDNDYRELLKLQEKKKLKISDKQIGNIQMHYLYARSMFPECKINDNNREAFNYYKEQLKKYWLCDNIYLEGLAALALYNYDDKITPFEILKSFKERAIIDNEMGMYWNEMQEGYYWYNAPVETQVIMIQVFEKIAKDKKAVDELKTWLIKQKQTQSWQTTKATTEAVYALMLTGTNWFVDNTPMEFTIGKDHYEPAMLSENKEEAGTGYFKKSWNAEDIVPSMGEISITKKNEGVSWGAMYWQYFEQFDKITPAKTALKIDKKLYIQKETANGKELFPLDENNPAHVGDIVVIRMVLTSDRRLEYVHLKDLRASCFEPMDVFSDYEYKGGLSFYQVTRDASTNYFFSDINEGTYVLEYRVRVTHSGEFSNGITTLQCMYAPQFSAHSTGENITIK